MEELDAQTALMFSFYEGLERKGPGSNEATCRAISMLDDLPDSPRIVEFGCGAGAAAMSLANAVSCHVTAVDVYQPFLDEVETTARRHGLAGRVTTLQADMAEPPFADESFDVVWSEGSIYLIGFEAGLRRWRRLLRPGGFVAVTELTWLCESPPQEVVDFWKSGYPDMSTIDSNLQKLRFAGFDPVDHFVLSPDAWENYYGPLEEHLANWQAQHSESVDAQSLSKATRDEIEFWKRHGSSYGYVFYVGQNK